jgi:DNA-binding GntR family transcriptional regulator
MLHAGQEDDPMNLPLTPPIERANTLQEKVYDSLRGAITLGAFNGEDIYSASQLAEQFGVSRTPVREALLQLAREGFLATIDGRGFQLRPASPQEVRDFYETRRLIEGYVISRIAAQISDTDIQTLSDIADMMSMASDEEDGEAFLRGDGDFHRHLWQLHSNTQLASILDHLQAHIPRLGFHAIAHPGRSLEVIDEHRAIIEALRSHNPEAARATVVQHLDASEATILEGFGETA